MSSLEDITSLLEQTKVTKENIVSIKGQAQKLDTLKDVSKLIESIDDIVDLQVLELTGNTVGVEAAKAIGEAISKKPELQKCLWADMFTGRLRNDIPISLKYLSDGMIKANAHIVELDLSDNAFGPQCAKACVEFLKSPSAYSLKKLKFNNNGLGFGGVILAEALIECHKLSSSAGNPLKLQVFVAGRNRLENPGAISLSKAFKEIGTLEEIHLPQNGIQHEGISALADCVKSNPKLRHLNLNDNTFTSKGAIAMADAIKCIDSLHVINFGDCLIRTEGAIALGESLKDSNPELKEMIASFGEVQIEGGIAICEAMLAKQDLIKLDINGNQFGEDGVTKITDLASQLVCEEAFVDLDDDEGSDDEEDETQEEHPVEESQEDEEEDEENLGLSAENLFSEINKDVLKKIKSEKLISLMNKFVEGSLNAEKAAQVFMTFTNLIVAEDLESENSNSYMKKIVDCCDIVMSNAFARYPSTQMSVLNPLLVKMGLIKNEESRRLQTVTDIRQIAFMLGHISQQPYFPQNLKKVVRSIVTKDNRVWDRYPQSRTRLMQSFYKIA